jgi:hypothetical protein
MVKNQGVTLNDPRFDSITRALASGQSRRAMLKALLAIGGGAAAGAGLGTADAARRPTPTPKPVSCPGQQVWDGAACVCLTGEKCGPDCCPVEAECCDNACCYGTCYGEELCCPSPREWCQDSGECCPDGWSCCPGVGCIANGSCCSDADCPRNTCAESICLENHICSELILNCDLGGSAACCGGNAVCHADGTCLPASITMGFVSGSANWCQPSLVLSGFLPNHTYDVEFGGLRGDLPINSIWRQLTTDQSGAFASTFNIAFVNGMDQAFATVENVTSGLVPVTC